MFTKKCKHNNQHLICLFFLSIYLKISQQSPFLGFCKNEFLTGVRIDRTK